MFHSRKSLGLTLHTELAIAKSSISFTQTKSLESLGMSTWNLAILVVIMVIIVGLKAWNLKGYSPQMGFRCLRACREQNVGDYTTLAKKIDLIMPDIKAGRELTGHVARPRCCRVCKISVFDPVLYHFYFPFFPTFEIAFFEKKKPSHSIFLPLYVEHCFRFEKLEFCDYRIPFFGSLGRRAWKIWQRSRRSQIFQALLPFFFFCLLPNIS